MRFMASLLTAFAISVFPAISGASPPWSWDQNQNNIDDHIDAVESQGLAAAFENGDLNGRMIIQLAAVGGVVTYNVLILYDHAPTAADEAALTGMGLPAHRFQSVPYAWSKATYGQIQAILARPGVVRVESDPVFYAMNDNSLKTQACTASNYEIFPTIAENLGFTGRGVVIGVLDTGVNDGPDEGTGYPGHESLVGKWVGGGNFSNVDPSLNTQLDESENPADRGPLTPHASHVSGSAMGTGGPSGTASGGFGFYRGVAPGARLVDCKVLTDAGVGSSSNSVAALDWIILHKDADWGLTGEDAVYRGVQVVNMSLGGLTGDSDGTDASSAAVNAAVRSGIAVCVASGNGGETNFISAPAAADLAVTVGAAIDANTLPRSDDVVASFSNEGPRRSDNDGDNLDEMKPDLCPPGGGITSVNGYMHTDGDEYVTINGTSMSCPQVAGLCALIIEACPGIRPDEVKRILRETSDHLKTGGKQPPDAFPFYQAIDPNYHPSWGWGFPHAYAALMEARYPNRTQVIRETGEAVMGGIDVHWTTQREVLLAGFHVLRADPVYGGRGPFQPITTALIAPQGDPNLNMDDNRTNYTFEDRDPALIPGETYWYRIRWIDQPLGIAHDEPAFPVFYDPPVPLVTLRWSIVHNSVDNDLLVIVGSGTDASDPVNTAHFFVPGPGTGAADSMRIVTGDIINGNEQYFWHLTLTDGDFGADQHLPPSANNPWFLKVTEGGFVDQRGRVESFSMVFHHPDGDITFTSLSPPQPTAETQSVIMWIPADPAASPNHAPVLEPVGAHEALEGRTLSFAIAATDADDDNLTYFASELPPGAAFDPATRTFSWSPDYSAVTSTSVFTATLEVQDDDPLGSLGDWEQLEIRLHDVDPAANLPPYWNPLPDQSVVRGETVSFKVSAVDPEGATLNYSVQGLPFSATFNPATRCFDWTTGPGNFGDYPVTFRVNDGVHPDVTEQVIITVKAGNPPTLGACESDIVTYEGTSSVGSFDLGNEDVDIINFTLDRDAVRLFARLFWVGNPAVDIDYRLEDSNGNILKQGASFNQPEVILVDNLAAGDYRFVVVGFTVPAETDWTLEADRCLSLGVSGGPEGSPPVRFRLAQSFPNPFAGPSTRIQFSLPEPSRVVMKVYDIRGALVRTLADEEFGPGVNEVVWDGSTDGGRPAASGLYFYRMEVPDRYMETRRLIRY